jgi:D-arabinose 1-dehydrogenase-like Zn-dependent alcohol dehydrogenase
MSKYKERLPGRTTHEPLNGKRTDIPGADFDVDVLIKVQACGICHSDVLTKEGMWPGIQYPRVPGHEVVGVIDELDDPA